MLFDKNSMVFYSILKFYSEKNIGRHLSFSERPEFTSTIYKVRSLR